MAFYRPTFLSPENQSVDPSIDNNFTCQVNVSGESVTEAELVILTLANVVVYTATPTVSPAIYDKDTLTITIPAGTLSAGNTYKQKVTTNPSSATPVYSKETLFYAYSEPTLSFSATPSTITSKSYEFVLNYYQAESIAPKQWKMIWFDEFDNIIEESDWSTSGSLKYTFDGFSDGETYSVIGYIESQLGQSVETEKFTFSVSYSKPNVNINAFIHVDNNTSVLTSNWSKAIQVTGVHSATPAYENNFLCDGNAALNLGVGENIYFDVDIPEDSSTTFLIKPASGFTGYFCKLTDSISGSVYEIGYNGSRFYFDINGYIDYSNEYEVGTNVFLICIHPTSIYVRIVG